MRIPLVLLLPAALVTGIALAAPPSHPTEATPRPAAPSTPGAGALSRPADTGAPEIQEIDHRIQALKSEFHEELDPLEARIRDVKARYEPQLQTLETQRHDLVEAGKSPAIQELDRQEAAELATLAEQEKAALDRVRADFADRRQQVRAKYQALRQQSKTASR